MERLAFILEAIERDTPVLFLVGGAVWEGHVQSCLHGELVAVARQVGLSRQYGEQRWQLDEIADMGFREQGDVVDTDEDGLFAQARLMVEQAREYGELSLAERLLRERTTREEHK